MTNAKSSVAKGVVYHVKSWGIRRCRISDGEDNDEFHIRNKGREALTERFTCTAQVAERCPLLLEHCAVEEEIPLYVDDK